MKSSVKYMLAGSLVIAVAAAQAATLKPEPEEHGAAPDGAAPQA